MLSDIRNQCVQDKNMYELVGEHIVLSREGGGVRKNEYI
jgi:hypothetical protein